MLSYHNRPFWVEHNVRRCFYKYLVLWIVLKNFLRKLRLHKYEKYLFTRMFVLQKFVWKKARLKKKIVCGRVVVGKNVRIRRGLLSRMYMSECSAHWQECACLWKYAHWQKRACLEEGSLATVWVGGGVESAHWQDCAYLGRLLTGKNVHVYAVNRPTF